MSKKHLADVKVEVNGKEEEPLIQNGNQETDEVDFAKVSLEEALKILQTSDHGLSSEEAERRLAIHGPNKLPNKTVHPIVRYLGYMWNPLAWCMEAAAIVSIALVDGPDFALVVALLLFNATISYFEEASADAAVSALTSALAPKSKALRDGQMITMDAAFLVPGDVILIRLGDVLPADVKLLNEEGLEPGQEESPVSIDQAALTGESLPVKKFASHVGFSGSSVKQGERHAVVYATGINTFFGRAAALISGTSNTANIQRVMNKISAICVTTLALWVIIEVVVQFSGRDKQCRGGREGCPTLLNVLVVMIGSIPIAMPTVLSVTLAMGGSNLAKEGAIVTRMSAVEEMAGMNVLCSDKTGTLTLNKLSVDTGNLMILTGHSQYEILKFGALSANTVTEEPIDMVLWNSFPEEDKPGLRERYKCVKYFPFNPNDKITIAYIHDTKENKNFRVLKGSPQTVLGKAHNFAELDVKVNRQMEEFAGRGFRSLGIAWAEGHDVNSAKWEMLSLIPLFDPPRHDTKETIERCQKQGIDVKMITGDHLLIGKETCKMLGMGTEMYPSEVLIKARNGDTSQLHGYKNFLEMVEVCNGFAQVFPEHKFEIVKILKDSDHVVGMTGDGVNDAPALKKADVGIAVADATDAARGAADIVLTEPGLSVIVTAVIGARKIFQRMTTYAKYTVAMTFRIAFTFGILTVAYDWYFPPIMLVIMTVFNDGSQIALSKDRVVASTMPNSWNIMNIFIMGAVYGLYLTLSSWALLHVALKTEFFEEHFNLPSLNDQFGTLYNWCEVEIRNKFPNIPSLDSPVCEVPQYRDQFDECEGFVSGDQIFNDQLPSVLEQCMVEQKYIRHSMARTLIYSQVSISGAALVFVIRTKAFSLFSRAGLATYLAFAFSQTASTLFGLFGLGGFEEPRYALEHCQFCLYSNHYNDVLFKTYSTVPRARTLSVDTASVIGCQGYVIAAWIWVAIWYVLLDPLKWAMMFILNDDGVRDRILAKVFKRPSQPAKTALGRVSRRELDRRSKEDIAGKEFQGPSGMMPTSYGNPLGRASMSKPVSQVLDRQSASVVAIDRKSMTISQDHERAMNIGRRSMLQRPSSRPIGRGSAPQGGLSRLSRYSTQQQNQNIQRGSPNYADIPEKETV